MEKKWTILCQLLLISFVLGVVCGYAWKFWQQEDSFKRFIQAEKAGTYHGVKMSPLINTKTYKHNGEWIVEIAGAGSESMVKTWEGK